MVLKQKLISSLIPLLKEKGYKKIRQNWYKEDQDIIVLFNIQNSCYNENEFYINLGIIIKKLNFQKSNICLANCHIQQRIENKNEQGVFLTAEMYIRILTLWEQWYGDLKKLRIRALENKLPMICTPEAKTFLTTVRLS